MGFEGNPWTQEGWMDAGDVISVLTLSLNPIGLLISLLGFFLFWFVCFIPIGLYSFFAFTTAGLHLAVLRDVYQMRIQHGKGMSGVRVG